MLSREPNEVDADYFTAMHELFDYLSNSAGENAIRVSVVTMQDSVRQLVWSQAAGGIQGYCNIGPIDARVPTMSDGEQLIIVESEQAWSPAFSVGLANYRFGEVAISRPRFSPQLVLDPALPPIASNCIG